MKERGGSKHNRSGVAQGKLGKTERTRMKTESNLNLFFIATKEYNPLLFATRVSDFGHLLNLRKKVSF